MGNGTPGALPGDRRRLAARGEAAGAGQRDAASGAGGDAGRLRRARARGDPARMPTDVSRLLGPEWIAARAAGIDRARATPSAQVYPWPGREAGEAAATMHLSVADGTGEMVALTSTLNGWFGCGVYVKGAGFLLNNEMDDFVV